DARLRIELKDLGLEAFHLRLAHIAARQHVSADVLERESVMINDRKFTDARARGDVTDRAATTSAANQSDVLGKEPLGFLWVPRKYWIDHGLAPPVFRLRTASLRGPRRHRNRRFGCPSICRLATRE